MKLAVILVLLVCLSIEGRDRKKSKKYGARDEEADVPEDPIAESFGRDWRYGQYGSSRRKYGSYDWDPSRRKYGSYDWDSYRRRYGSESSRKMKYTKLKLDRKMFYYWDSVYENWTNWTECDPVACISSRMRKCKDNSWEENVRNFRVEKKCPVKMIYERRKCSNVNECSKDYVDSNNHSVTSLPKTCGKRPEFIQTKVFGGKETAKNSWPWHGGLYVTGTYRSPIYICGATLINPGWAVTAAHCLRTLKSIDGVPLGEVIDTRKYNLIDKFQLTFGDHDRNEKEMTEKVTKISHFIIHPSFRADYTSNLYDVALLKLDTLIPKQKNIDFACIPESANYTLSTSTTCHAIGWGFVTSQDPFNIWSLEFNWLSEKSKRRRERQSKSNSEILREVEIPLVEFEKCQRIFRIFNLKKNIHLCAGSSKKDTCRGDSGGGLFCLDPDTNRWQLYGITNFGSARGCGKSYGVYVRVAALVDWIKEILQLPI